DEAEALAAKGEMNLILCRHETSPEDIRGMNASLGFMTAFGGMTSHAALVARQMGKVCIVGCDALSFDYHARTMTVETAKGTVVIKEGDWISIDGFAGEVINGRVDTAPSEVIRVLIDKTLDAKEAPVYQTYAKLMSCADAGSAAPRVPPARRSGRSRPRDGDAPDGRPGPRAHRGAQGVEPDARPSRLPPRHHVPRDHRDAGARDLRGGRRGLGGGLAGD